MDYPVDRQLAAYNARDVDAYMACFTEDVKVENGAGEVIVEGWQSVYDRYAIAFAREPGVHCLVTNQIRFGDYVIDHEHLTGYIDGSTREAVAIYRVRGDLIEHIRFL